jgi:polyhydroxybutyrate depolymerase
MRRPVVLAVAFVLTLGVAMFAGANVINALERQSYTVTHSMKVDGRTRTWEEIAPVAELPRSAPVIVVLSGIAASVQDEVSRDRLVPYVNAGLAELVYPAGYDESWNAGGCCGKAAAAGVDDVAFLKALVARVDPGHQHPVYVVGYSNGGRLAYRIACSDPGLFDATAVVKAMPMPGCVVTRPLTILQVASLDDTAVPYQPGDPGKESPPATVEVARLRATDGCTGNGVVSPHAAMTMTTWTGCASGDRVGLAVWDTGGHNFPPPKGDTPGAAAIIWSFFTSTALAPVPR